jgi:integrase
VPFLYRPQIVDYRLPDGSTRDAGGQRVTKRTPGAVRTVRKSESWYGRWVERDGDGKVIRRCQQKLSNNKETAQRMLSKKAGDAELGSVGLLDFYARHRRTPLATHLEAFLRGLSARGDSAMHVKRTGARIAAVLAGCAFESTKDVNAGAVLDFLAGLRDRPKRPLIPLDAKKEKFTLAEVVAALRCHPHSVRRMLDRLGLTGEGNGRARRYPRAAVLALQERLCRGGGVATFNHYVTAARGFTRWLARERRIDVDPLAHLTRQNAEEDVRHVRRALPEDLFGRFIDATAGGATFRDLSGADRLVLYTLAANTGFRAGELASLTPASFALEGERPTVTVGAAYSKRRRTDVQPLRSDVADLMRRYLRGKPRRQPLWPGSWKDAAAELVRHDLAAAGIPYVDEDGAVFDFHALRGQFITMLAKNGVHPKVAQVLARHSTIGLTMDRYTDAGVLDLAGALDAMPAIPPAAQKGRRAGVNPVQGASGTCRKAIA